MMNIRLDIAISNLTGRAARTGTLHPFFMRIKTKKGYMEAVMANARKLAVINWNMPSKEEQYQPTEDTAYTENLKAQTLKIYRKTQKIKYVTQRIGFE